jgi:hypothetical protein
MESHQTFNTVAFAEVLKELTTRLIRTWNFTEHDLAPRSLYHLVTLIHLLAGHRNYVGQHTITCYTLERIFGDAIYEEPLIEPKPEAEPESSAEPTQVVN